METVTLKWQPLVILREHSVVPGLRFLFWAGAYWAGFHLQGQVNRAWWWLMWEANRQMRLVTDWQCEHCGCSNRYMETHCRVQACVGSMGGGE